MIVNEGLKSQNDPKVTIAANKKNVAIGYYKLFANSNVTLICNGKTYWWGVRPGEKKGTPFAERVESGSGVIKLTLNP